MYKCNVEQSNRGKGRIQYLFHLKPLSMDVICRCAFGIDTDMQNDVNNVYLKTCADGIEQDLTKLPIVKLSNLIPFLIPLLKFIFIIHQLIYILLRKLTPEFLSRFIPDMPLFWIIDRVEEVVKLRTSNDKNKRGDLLQFMLDAVIKKNGSEELMSKYLYPEEVVINVYLFMIGGYETTATTLANCTYVLATHAKVQTKLQAEIDQQWKGESNGLDYDTVSNLVYLDYFVREVMRMHPVAIVPVNRECNKTTNVCGYEVEKGSVIQADVYSLHYDPQLWGPDDPRKFLPERHSIKRHPMAFMPFGGGPRNCAGMRMGLLEVKMCLARLLHSYTILPGAKLEEGMDCHETVVVIPDSINIRVEKRFV